MSYTSENIQTLRFPDSVRVSPGVYIGAVDSDGYWLILREGLDNGLDEFLAGRNKGVALVEDKDGSFWIYDQGAGIPQGTKSFTVNINGKQIESKMPTMQAVFSELHTSGKYRSDAYKTSVGCFTGDTVVTFLEHQDKLTIKELYTKSQIDQTPIKIWTRDIEKDEVFLSTISNVQLTKYTDELVEVTLSTGKKIQCTPNHGFYTRSLRGIRKVPAEHLKPNSLLVSYESATEIRVESAKKIAVDSPVPVFDLTVDKTHTFFVEEVLVSNSHGLGVKASNALSEFFDVFTCYKDKWYSIGFKKGILTSPVVKCQPPVFQGKALQKGTLIHLKHDKDIFKRDTSLDFNKAKSWAEITSYLNPGFSVILRDKSGNTFKYHSKEGAKEFVSKILSDLKAEAEPTFFEFKNELADVVVSFSNAEGNNIRGYTNGLYNSDGGKHVDSVSTALYNACKLYAKSRQVLSAYDFKEGLVGIVNMHLHKAEFSSQDKLKLTDSRAGADFQAALEKAATDFFKKNKSLAMRLCEKASKLSELRNQFKASKKMITAINSAKKRGMPAKYAPYDSKSKLEDRELLIVEGESAGGSLREVRAPYQAMLPLKGKCVNVLRCAEQRALESDEIINILSAVGYDPKSENPAAKLQVNRVICLADHDDDGCFKVSQKVILCNGTTKTFKELSDQWEKDHKPIWVWSLDSDGNIHPAKAFDPSIRCYRTKEVHVHLDSGDEIICTMKHPFAMNYCSSNNAYFDDHGIKYLYAKDLKPGDSIMSAYFADYPLNGNKDNKNLYKHVLSDKPFENGRKYYPLHKIVAKEAYPEEYEVYSSKNSVNKNSMAIHHKDHDRMNNTPENLEIITAYSHTKDHHSFNKNGYNGSKLQKQKLKAYHQSSKYINEELPKRRQRRVEYNKSEKNRQSTAALNQREDVKLLQIAGKYARAAMKLKACGLKANKENFSKVFCSAGFKLDAFNTKFIIDNFELISDRIKITSNKPLALQNLSSYIVNDPSCINACMTLIRQLIREDRFSKEEYDLAVKSDNSGILCKYNLLSSFIKSEYNTTVLDYAKSTFKNHKVVKVEIKELDEPEPFYCLTVPKYGNFLLADKNGNGICSSNCHINTLLLTIFYKFLPQMFDKGMIYVADMPEFYAEYKNTVVVGQTLSEVKQKLADLGAPKSTPTPHIKGWGEISQNLLKSLVVDKNTRKLIRIKPITDNDRVTFVRVMNEDVAFRRQMLGLSDSV